MTDLDLLVIGDLNPDLILAGSDVRPEFGQVERLVDSARLTVGGSGMITAVAATRLGLSAGICGVVGDDFFGRYLLAEAERLGVDRRYVRVDPEVTTGITVVLVEPSDRAMLTYRGAIARLSPADLQALPVRPAEWVHSASYFLMDTDFRKALPQVFRAFRREGVRTSVDTNWDPAKTWDVAELLTACDLILPNAGEALAVSGASTIEEAGRWLAKLVGRVAVKCGQEGAVLWRGDRPVSASPPQLAEGMVDSVGAGDCFDAALIAALVRGLPDEEALSMAVAVATLSTRGVGGVDGLPTWEEARKGAAR